MSDLNQLALTGDSQEIAALQQRIAELERENALLKELKTSQINSKQEAIEAKQKIIDLFMQAPAVIMVTFGPQHLIELVNTGFLQTVRRQDPAELVGKSIREALPEFSGQGFFELMDQVYQTGQPFAGNEILVELDRLGNKQLEPTYFNFVYQPFRNNYGEIYGILTHAIEVTKQVEAHKELETLTKELEVERTQLQNLFAQAPAGIAILRGPTHIYEIANPNYMLLIGQDRDVLGKDIRQALPELAGQGIYELLDQVYQTGQPFIGNELLVKLDRLSTGEWDNGYFNFVYQPLVDSEGQVEGIFVHVVEVTELVLARQKAEQLAAELEAVIESMPDAIYIGDANGIKRVNRQAYEMLGYSSQKELEVDLAEIFATVNVRAAETGETVPPDRAVFARAAKGESSTEEYLLSVNGQDRDIFIRAAGAPIEKDGQVIGAISIHSDITERKQAEEALRQAHQELERVNQSKDEFLAIISHDLRSPLTSLQGFAQLLQRNLAKQAKLLANGENSVDSNFIERSLQNVRTIMHQSNRMNELINRLIEFSRVQTGNLNLKYVDQANIVNLVQQVVEQRSIASDDHQIVLQTSEPEVITRFDAARMEQVLDNLITNAAKYSPANTTVTVGVERKSDTNEVLIWVKDEGYGISAEAQKHLFERFYREQNERTEVIKGLGLGLYISQEIVHQHGGRIWVESQPERGSVFYVALPLLTAE